MATSSPSARRRPSGAINLGAGADSLILSSAGNNTLTVSAVETITGGSGADVITLGAALVGGIIDLAGGADTLTLFNGTNTLTVSNVETITGGTAPTPSRSAPPSSPAPSISAPAPPTA